CPDALRKAVTCPLFGINAVLKHRSIVFDLTMFIYTSLVYTHIYLLSTVLDRFLDISSITY
ncbi:hypothetical protein MEO40_27390, partial [Dolichospermum sp. ST_sed1]|nr:hypothetical protein [Dolichospermum sp. ST_sed1]